MGASVVNAFKDSQAQMLAELRGIHTGLDDMGKRMDRIEGIVYASPRGK